MANYNGINVYSEIGKLRKVLVHRPGDELKYVTPSRIDELLMSAIIEVEQAQQEHDAFTAILKKEGVEVVELADLVAEMYKKLDNKEKEAFLAQWLKEASWGKTKTNDALAIKPAIGKKVLSYLNDIAKKSPRKLADKMMAGILLSEIGEKPLKGKNGKQEIIIDLAVDPMPNILLH